MQPRGSGMPARLRFSAHARRRLQQRGIPTAAVFRAIRTGLRQPAPGDPGMAARWEYRARIDGRRLVVVVQEHQPHADPVVITAWWE